jgi:hypothetical protein
MDRDDPYDRHRQDIENQNYWDNKRRENDEDDKLKTENRDLTIRRDLTLTEQPAKQPNLTTRCAEGLVQERNNCGYLIRRITWLGSQGWEWCERLNSIDLTSRSGALTELQLLRDQIREHERFLWDYGKPRELATVREAVSSLGRVISLYLTKD